MHAGYACDVALPLAGTVAVESRAASAATAGSHQLISRRSAEANVGSHQLVVTFAKPVTLAGATVASQDGAATVSESVSGTVVTLDLSNVADAQQVTVTLSNVNDGTRIGDVRIPVAFLLGDANGDHVVNSADALQTRDHSGELTNEANYRLDSISTARSTAPTQPSRGTVRATPFRSQISE